jgi:hypothetical protein
LFTQVDTALGRFYNVAADYHHTVNQDPSAAMHLCHSGLSLAISIKSFDGQSKALHRLAWLKVLSGDISGAREDAFESQRAARVTGNLLIGASALWAEAFCWQCLGSYGQCVSLLNRATHLLDMCGMIGGAVHGNIRNSQAEVHRSKSEYVEARNIHIQILCETSPVQNPYRHALALINIAQIDVEIGGFENDMQQNISTAALLFCRINFSFGLTSCEMIQAALDVQQDNLSAARCCFQKCLQSAWGKDTEVVTYCLEKLAAVEQWVSTGQNSFLWTVTFLVHSIKCKQRLELHKALQFLGTVFQGQGDPETAINLTTVALDGFTQMDVHRSRAECMVQLGDISKLNGDELKALKLWEIARPLFERSSQMKQLACLDERITTLSCDRAQEAQRRPLTVTVK